MNKTLKSSLLATCVILSLASAHQARAATVQPGTSVEVNPGDTPNWWAVNNGSLTINPGARADYITASSGGYVLIDGANYDVSSFVALGLFNSTGVIRNSNLRVLDGDGVRVGGSSADAVTPAAKATVQNSNIFAIGMGVSAGVGASILVDNSVFEAGLDPVRSGYGDGYEMYLGTGIFLSGAADIRVQNGSRMIGDEQGIYVDQTFVGLPQEDIGSTIVVDDSIVQGKNGPGIYVPQFITQKDPGAKIVFQNGAKLLHGDGNLVLVERDVFDLDFVVSNTQLEGDIVNTSGATVDVSLDRGAMLIGRIVNGSSMTIDNAVWRLAGDSNVDTLNLNSGAQLGLGAGALIAPTFNTLTIDRDFNGGGGTILFNTVLSADGSDTDRLIVNGDTNGTAFVRVNNVGGAGAQTLKGIELITVAGASNGQFDLVGRAVGGQYDYSLFKDAGNWYLRSQLPTAPDPCDAEPSLPGCGGGVDPVDPVDPVEPPVPVLRPEGGAYLANLQATQTLFRLGYHDRHAGQNSGRAWARVDGSRTGFDAISRQLNVQGNSQSQSVGADVWRNDSGSGAGVMLSSGNATSTATNPLSGYYARGKVKGEALGVYGTWRPGNAVDPYAGFYLDGSLQRAQFRNRVEGVGLATERYDSRGWQGAIETGYAFRLGGAQTGWIFLEPQLQVGYNRWDDLRHTEANGTAVTTQDADGLYGRVGLRLSGVTRWGGGTADVQPYIAANWLHTRTESQVWMGDERVDARIPRSRAEVSAGASLKFANGLGAWAGLARQQASGYNQTSAQLGMSYSW